MDSYRGSCYRSQFRMINFVDGALQDIQAKPPKRLRTQPKVDIFWAHGWPFWSRDSQLDTGDARAGKGSTRSISTRSTNSKWSGMGPGSPGARTPTLK